VFRINNLISRDEKDRASLYLNHYIIKLELYVKQEMNTLRPNSAYFSPPNPYPMDIQLGPTRIKNRVGKRFEGNYPIFLDKIQSIKYPGSKIIPNKQLFI
jgi:hypothetical protein